MRLACQLLAVTASVAACVTTPTRYQAMTGGYGVRARTIDSGEFEITVVINKHTASDSAVAYLEREARSVCTTAGAASFHVVRSHRTFKRRIVWTGPLSGWMGHDTRVDAIVRCASTPPNP